MPLAFCPAAGSFDLNSSGNLRPSPRVSGGSELVKKRMMIQQSLHGREVCASGLHGGFVLVGEEEDDDSTVSAWERGVC